MPGLMKIRTIIRSVFILNSCTVFQYFDETKGDFCVEM